MCTSYLRSRTCTFGRMCTSYPRSRKHPCTESRHSESKSRKALPLRIERINTCCSLSENFSMCTGCKEYRKEKHSQKTLHGEEHEITKIFFLPQMRPGRISTKFMGSSDSSTFPLPSCPALGCAAKPSLNTGDAHSGHCCGKSQLLNRKFGVQFSIIL